MKPSELIKSYILSKQLPKQQNELSKYFECCFERLDNNFIDREELYKQVKEILDESLTKACLKAIEDKDFIKEHKIKKPKIEPRFFGLLFLYMFSISLLLTPILFICDNITNIFFKLLVGYGFACFILVNNYLILYIDKRYYPNGVKKCKHH